MKVSFIIITYHRGPLLIQCLDSIYRQKNLTKPFEVIVIDNGNDVELPPPPSQDIHLRIEKPSENLGVAGGRNLGMSLAQGEYWVILDDDATWHDNYDAARLIQHLDTNSSCGGVGIKILDPITNAQVEELLPHPKKSRVSNLVQAIEVPYFYGGGHILRANAVRTVGDYPERFFYAMEEVDLCLRLIDAGFQVLYDPNVAAYHHTNQTGRTVFGEKYWKRNTLNKSRIAWRLLPQPYPWTIMIIWSIATLIKTRNPGAVWEVWGDLWKERKVLLSERKPIKPQTVDYLHKIEARLLY